MGNVSDIHKLSKYKKTSEDIRLVSRPGTVRLFQPAIAGFPAEIKSM